MYRFGFLYYSIYEIDTSVILSKLRQNVKKKSFLQLGQHFRKNNQIESLKCSIFLGNFESAIAFGGSPARGLEPNVV